MWRNRSPHFFCAQRGSLALSPSQKPAGVVGLIATQPIGISWTASQTGTCSFSASFPRFDETTPCMMRVHRYVWKHCNLIHTHTYTHTYIYISTHTHVQSRCIYIYIYRYRLISTIFVYVLPYYRFLAPACNIMVQFHGIQRLGSLGIVVRAQARPLGAIWACLLLSPFVLKACGLDWNFVHTHNTHSYALKYVCA